jgi:hypothetical protein
MICFRQHGKRRKRRREKRRKKIVLGQARVRAQCDLEIPLFCRCSFEDTYCPAAEEKRGW